MRKVTQNSRQVDLKEPDLTANHTVEMSHKRENGIIFRKCCSKSDLSTMGRRFLRFLFPSVQLPAGRRATRDEEEVTKHTGKAPLDI